MSFDNLKEILITEPMLCHPNFEFSFIVQTDASDYAIACVLSQCIEEQEKVVSFISRILQEGDRKWCVREKKL